MKRIFLVPILLLLSSQGNPAQQNAPEALKGCGSIQGQVVDENGKPIEKAQVTALPHESQVGGLRHSATTNKKGEFLLTQVPTGATAVIADKEEEGYPDLIWAAFSQGVNSIPEVTVEKGKTTSGVTVHLIKGASLSGAIVDSESGQPILNATIMISRDDDHSASITTGADEMGRFQLAIPAKPFNIKVSQPNYATWENGETAPHAKGPSTLLTAGMHRELLIRLEGLKRHMGDKEKPKPQ